MKPTFLRAIIGAVAIGVCAAFAETIETHKVFRLGDVKWTQAPTALPKGAEWAILHGDPQSTGMFTLRIKMPKGYVIAPHMHPRPEVVTVISGKLHLGLGKSADRASVESLPAGSFFVMPQGVVHYAFVEEDAVLQISAIGPWSTNYPNLKDDPRLQGAPDFSSSER
jgi:quercetin dioxygenase-like cupin family protein